MYPALLLPTSYTWASLRSEGKPLGCGVALANTSERVCGLDMGCNSYRAMFSSHAFQMYLNNQIDERQSQAVRDVRRANLSKNIIFYFNGVFQVNGHSKAMEERHYKIQRINESARSSLEIADMLDPTMQSSQSSFSPARVPVRIRNGSLAAASPAPVKAAVALKPSDYGRLHSQVSYPLVPPRKFP